MWSALGTGGSDGIEWIDLRDGIEVEFVVWCTLAGEGWVRWHYRRRWGSMLGRLGSGVHGSKEWRRRMGKRYFSCGPEQFEIPEV